MNFIIPLILVISIFKPNYAFYIKNSKSIEVADSINKFSLNFLKSLKYEKENIIYSPLSISIALGMLLKGAHGNTAQEIRSGLQLRKENDNDIHSVMKEVISVYDSLESNKHERNVSINLANLALIANGYSIKRDFMSNLRENYKALVSEADFKKNGENVKNEINDFVRKNTKGHIEQLIEEPLDPETRLQLINTVYFEGYWESTFSKGDTNEATFYNSDKTESRVEMMGGTMGVVTPANVYNDDEIRSGFFEIKYNGNLSMILVIPHERYGLKSVVDQLTPEKIDRAIKNFRISNPTLTLPKFKLTQAIDLKEVLPFIGVRRPFEYYADFSGITDQESLYVSSALHKASINVEEGGTVATAATSVTPVANSAYIGPNPVANHPFAYIIRDNVNGFNLFVGVVNKL